MKKFYIILFLIILIVITGFIFLDKNVQAISGDNVYGYAWSDNIGWISFNNCANPNVSSTCTGHNYGVKYDEMSGNLSGYAWSDNIGWISFNETGCPSGSCDANLNLTTGALTGWAKALSFSNDAESSEWADGWISLSGSSPSYGVNFDMANGNGSGYAWGGNVIGWVDFSQVKIIPVNVVDLCQNINGIQDSVPSGMITDLFGNCIDPLDVCPNLPNIQTSVPVDMVISPANGWCIYQVGCTVGQILVNGECVTPGVVPISCTFDQTNDITNIPCYCSAHPSVTEPVDCLHYCQNNPSACKKAPKYKEN